MASISHDHIHSTADPFHSAYDLMTWEDIASIDRQFFSVGSHTMTHQPLAAAANQEELRYEVEESRVMLEQRTGMPIRHFCYPDGSINSAAADMVRCYYQTAVTTRPGLLNSPLDRHQLPRIGSDPDLAEFAWRLLRSQSSGSA